MDSTPKSHHRRRLTKVSVIGAGNVEMAIAQTTILTRDLADEIALVDSLRGEMLDLQHAAAFLPRRTRLVSDTDMSVSVTRGSDLAIVTAGARQIPGETRLELSLLERNVALLFRPLTDGMDSTPTSHHHQWHRMAAHSMVILLFAMCSTAAAASRVLRTNSSTTAGTPTPTPRAPFCGFACCCSAEDELKLQEAFVNEVKAHGYDDAGCRSHLKAYICAVCLPPAPASQTFSNTTASITNNSSLPLPCASATPLSVSIHDLTSSPPSTETATPDWLLAGDDGKASTTPKWLIALISSLAITLLGGFVTYSYKIGNARFECCNNINCCLCWL